MRIQVFKHLKDSSVVNVGFAHLFFTRYQTKMTFYDRMQRTCYISVTRADQEVKLSRRGSRVISARQTSTGCQCYFCTHHILFLVSVLNKHFVSPSLLPCFLFYHLKQVLCSFNWWRNIANIPHHPDIYK